MSSSLMVPRAGHSGQQRRSSFIEEWQGSHKEVPATGEGSRMTRLRRILLSMVNWLRSTTLAFRASTLSRMQRARRMSFSSPSTFL